MREKIADKKERLLKIAEVFDEIYKDADCTLEYDDPLQLLISTQLAAQCTDKRVNIVAKTLYKKYPDVYAFAGADEPELREDIKPTGFFRNKAKNIIACCRMLIDEYGGEVPQDMEDLLRLPGVGRKTANLVRGDWFGLPGVVVDTHASRLSRRMGFTKETDPARIEADLEKLIPPERQTGFCHCLVYHGREYCSARRARCGECPIAEYCPKIGV
ncbi:MAG TPA: endonuclease III [Candidatus Monoglobus merdigallinarum]|uniref:Endonuclease III n=1 Tax=Candidatus Monoglobus merdigallinarum TaxID=2838698 RepID=A0A9D1PR69_9FIRM|nr:endonuclease III [Candidatus Monoglobus merdigallinarum]